VKKTEEDTSGTAKDRAAQHDKKHGKEGEKPAEESQSVYLTLGERRIGTYGRAFNFPVDVNHDATTAKLHAGLLRLTVPKLAADAKIDKKVSVQTREHHETSSQGVRAPEVSQ
jgi:Hsp20/alpha crystallin family